MAEAPRGFEDYVAARQAGLLRTAYLLTGHRQDAEDLTAQGELPASVPVEDGPAPRDAGLERAVQRALAQLPEGQRIPIVMHRFEGMGFAEIAEALGLTESAVKVRAHRGYARLRELLAALREETR